MNRVLQVLSTLVLACFAFSASALADDWLVTKLRGNAVQLVAGDWAPLVRGDVVPDDRVIRTLAGARAMLQRGAETIEVAANTQIRIIDRQGGKPFTIVQQYFGTVSIEAEVRNVQHFAVQTPYLAAVVKGTRFEVKTSSSKSAVAVRRGHVEVEDLRTHAHTLLAAGQRVTVDKSGSFVVGGRGTKPVILSATGEVVSADAAARGLVTAGVSADGVSVGVETVLANGNVGLGKGGAGVTVDLPGSAGVNGNVGGNGVGATVNAGGTGAGVAVGGGHGATVSVGGTNVHVGLGGLL